MYVTLIVVLHYEIKNSSFPMLSDILTDTDFRESQGMWRELANNTEKKLHQLDERALSINSSPRFETPD
jgi:hypothetical protein